MTEQIRYSQTDNNPYRQAEQLVKRRIRNIEEFFSTKQIIINNTPHIIFPNIIDALMQDSRDATTRWTIKGKVLLTLDKLKSNKSIQTETYEIKEMGKKVDALSLNHAYLLLAELINQPDIITLTPQQRTQKGKKNGTFGKIKNPDQTNQSVLTNIQLSYEDQQFILSLGINNEQFVQMLINRQNNNHNRNTMPVSLFLDDFRKLNALIDAILSNIYSIKK